MNTPGTGSAWQEFWDRGGWWRALLLLVVYLALYLGAGWIGGTLFDDQIRPSMFSTAASVFVAVTLPLMVGAIIIALFLLSVGWFRPLFGPQPVGGRWWMWIAPALIITLVMRYVGIDYSVYPGSAIVMTLVTGLFIGFVEEVITRGIVVKMLRDAGTAEWAVMLGVSLRIRPDACRQHLLRHVGTDSRRHRSLRLRVRDPHVCDLEGDRLPDLADPAPRPVRPDSLPLHRRHRRGRHSPAEQPLSPSRARQTSFSSLPPSS